MDLRTTQRYVHPSDADVRRAFDEATKPVKRTRTREGRGDKKVTVKHRSPARRSVKH